MQKIVLIGAGGHCKSCIDVIENQNLYQIIGLVDNIEKKNNEFQYPIIGNDKNLPLLRKKYKFAFVTLGQIKSPTKRIKIFRILKKNKFILHIIYSKNAIISKNSQIDEGTIIMHHSLINSHAKIGKNCIINSSALIEHDSIISDHSHISTGAIINGNVKVGEGTFIGSRSVVKEGVNICNNCIIGTGSIIKKDIKNNQTIK